jgi:hypothetical protein
MAVTAVRFNGIPAFRQEIVADELLDILESIVERLHEICQSPLSGPSFVVLFPLLRTSLVASYSFNLQDLALSLMELHTNPGPAYPRASTCAHSSYSGQ